MRIVLLALALCAASPAGAAYIEGELGFGCRELADQRRVDRAAGAGDSAGSVAIINELLASRRCAALPDGLRVRIEETSFPYSCVTKFGTAGPCWWVRQRHVNPKD